MKRILFPVLLACVVGACGGQAGSPVGPTGVQLESGVVPTGVAPSATAWVKSASPNPIDDSYISESCVGFRVFLEGTGKLKEFPLPDGRTKVLFPGFRVTLTNIVTGKQITMSATGSFHITELPNGNTEFVYTGRNTYDDPVSGRLLLLIGRFREVYGPAFDTVEPLQGNGQIVDHCAALA